jgi:hypothetical protein
MTSHASDNANALVKGTATSSVLPQTRVQASTVRDTKTALNTAGAAAKAAAYTNDASVRVTATSTPQDISFADKAYADAIAYNDLTIKYLNFANDAVSFIDSAIQQSLGYLNAIPSANPGNAENYSSLIEDLLSQANKALQNSISGQDTPQMGSGTGTGGGTAAGVGGALGNQVVDITSTTGSVFGTKGGTGAGSAPSGTGAADLVAKKAAVSALLSGVKSSFKDLLPTIRGGGSISCPEPIVVNGVNFSICLSRFSDQFSFAGLSVYAMSAFYALIVVLS